MYYGGSWEILLIHLTAGMLFFLYKLSNFIKNHKGANQVHRKYTRETHNHQNKNKNKIKKDEKIVKTRYMKVIIGNHPVV
jgi:Sec-independent protein translocase protein TatA